MNLKKISAHPRIYWCKASKKALNYYRSLYYSGHQILCGICGWKGQLFFNEKCPKCNSIQRTRLVPYSLQYFNLIEKNLSILHIAPSIKEYAYVKDNFESLFQYDRLDIKQRKHTNIKRSITDTKMVSEAYDLAIAWHVLEHIPNDMDAISEVYRILKKGGHFLVCVPIYPTGNKVTYENDNIPYEKYTEVHGHYDHCRSCGLDYNKRFESVGFKTDTLLVNSLNQTDLDYFGLRDDHVVWCFTK